MPKYDVHSYRQIRVKVLGVEADGPQAAIESVEGNEAVDAEIRRLVNTEGATGPVADVEYQDGGVPVGWLVDPLDEDEEGHGDGIAYDAGRDLTPVLANDTSKLPSGAQSDALDSFGIDRAPIGAYLDARNVSARLDDVDPLAAGVHRMLDGADLADADLLVEAAIQKLRDLSRRIAERAAAERRGDARIPPSVARTLAEAGLTASFAEAEDDQVDDEIEIRVDGFDEPAGSIQLCGADGFMASTWTGRDMEARRHGVLQSNMDSAAADAIALLRRDSWIS